MATVMNSVVAAAQISTRVPGGTSLRFPDRKQYRESTNATPGMPACLHSPLLLPEAPTPAPS